MDKMTDKGDWVMVPANETTAFAGRLIHTIELPDGFALSGEALVDGIVRLVARDGQPAGKVALRAAPQSPAEAQPAAKLVVEKDGVVKFIRPTGLGLDLPAGEYPLHLHPSPAEAQAQGGGKVVAQFYVSDKMEELCPIADMAPGRIRELLGNGTHDLVARTAPPSAPVGLAEAWQKGYRQGVLDERTSQDNIGIAGFGAKVEPARNNPYALAQQPAAVDGAEGCVHGCVCGCCRACKNGSCEPVRYAVCDCTLAAQTGGSDNDR